MTDVLTTVNPNINERISNCRFWVPVNHRLKFTKKGVYLVSLGSEGESYSEFFKSARLAKLYWKRGGPVIIGEGSYKPAVPIEHIKIELTI